MIQPINKIEKLQLIIIKITNIFYEPLLRIKLICDYSFKKKTYLEKTYYTDCEHKSKFRIHYDQILHIIKYGEINIYYYLYGFDRKDCSYMSDFINYRTFAIFRDANNGKVFPNYQCILRDKVLFAMFLENYGVATPHNYGIVEKGEFFNFADKSRQGFLEFISKEDRDLFVKIIDGECGKGVFSLKYRKDSDEILVDNQEITKEQLMKMISAGNYVVQEKITQHEKINSLYSNSINTIRLVTFYDKKVGEVKLLPSVFRVGCNGANVDNWSQGGISIGIDSEKGTLRKIGLLRPEYAERLTKHPNTGIVFDGFEIPYFDEIVEKAKFIHSRIPQIQSVGWDVAITQSGCTFVEGNDNWEVSLNSACNIEDARMFKELFS